MPASPIRRLALVAERAVSDGVHVHHLNIGQPDIESPPEFWAAVRGTDKRVLDYAPSPGYTWLREKLAAYYQGIGIDVSGTQVVVTTAGSEALLFAMMACLDPGDEAILPEPCYANYIGFAVAAGVRIVPITTVVEADFRLPTAAEFERRLSSRTRAILLCNPSNPTGTVYSREQLHDLRDLALKHDLFVLSDEVYRDFNYTGEPITSALQIEGLERHAVMLDSASKRYSLCGARIGFLASRIEQVVDAATRLCQARLSPPTLEQLGVGACFDLPASYYDGVRREYQARRDYLVERLRAMPGVVVPRIDGAFYAMVRLPIDDCDAFCRWLLEEFRLNGETVMLAPGTGFYETEGLGRDEARVAYVLGRPALDRALDCLESALAAYPGRTLAAARGASS